jgi:hypothetical protein
MWNIVMENQKESSRQQKIKISRRDFMGAAAAVAAFTFVPKRTIMLPSSIVPDGGCSFC